MWYLTCIIFLVYMLDLWTLWLVLINNTIIFARSSKLAYILVLRQPFWFFGLTVWTLPSKIVYKCKMFTVKYLMEILVRYVRCLSCSVKYMYLFTCSNQMCSLISRSFDMCVSTIILVVMGVLYIGMNIWCLSPWKPQK